LTTLVRDPARLRSSLAKAGAIDSIGEKRSCERENPHIAAGKNIR